MAIVGCAVYQDPGPAVNNPAGAAQGCIIGDGDPRAGPSESAIVLALVQNLGAMGPWPIDGGFGSSLLEEFKSNKTKSFELAEIAGHVVEFSADQYGSHFIQQKLEAATTEEKAMVFQEINPYALTHMTDVFGNYVIQKFFEHGMPTQKRELFFFKLDGHVLTLSFQMYGCHVIQRTVERFSVTVWMVKESILSERDRLIHLLAVIIISPSQINGLDWI